MKVLVADALSKSFTDLLESAGITVVQDAAAKGDALVAALAKEEPEALVVRSTRVDGDAIAASKNLELIVRAGAGYDTIDVSAASANGIFVANCPGKNATAVAELTMGLILSLDRQIPDNVSDARAGRWNKGAYSKAKGLKGRTLGLVGLGNIGTEVASRALAFEMNVVAWSRSLTPSRAKALGVTYCESPREVAEVSDIVSLHVASTPDTRHLADREFLRAMRDGAFLINTTRSAVIDEAALVEAMDSKGLRVALDVFEGEPAAKQGEFAIEIASHPGVYISHHIGASTEQAQEAIAMEAGRVLLAYRESGDVPNCVNIADQTPATHQITVRHLDKVGVLARVLDQISKAGWNIQEMENLVFAGAVSACARIRFDGQPDAGAVDAISRLEDVLAVTVIKL